MIVWITHAKVGHRQAPSTHKGPPRAGLCALGHRLSCIERPMTTDQPASPRTVPNVLASDSLTHHGDGNEHSAGLRAAVASFRAMRRRSRLSAIAFGCFGRMP